MGNSSRVRKLVGLLDAHSPGWRLQLDHEEKRTPRNAIIYLFGSVDAAVIRLQIPDGRIGSYGLTTYAQDPRHRAAENRSLADTFWKHVTEDT
jgi:hypothetical protein